MTYTFDLDMTPGGVPQIIRLSRYDKNTPTLKFNLWDGPTAYTIEAGSTVFINGTKPDDTSFEYYCEYSGSEVTVNVTEQMTAVAGRTTCEIIVYTNGERKGSANFYLDVEPSALSDDTVISETDIPIIQRIPEIAAEVETAKYLAQQWAVGSGSGQDIPSDTNNAYYWAMQAASYAGGGLKPEIVQELPTTNISTSTLYFVPSQNPTSSNIYDEYINTTGTTAGWELIGTTAIDMSNYYTKTETNTLLAAKQDSTDNNLNTTSKQIVGAINELKASMASTDIVADQYDATATYTVDDYCIYNGNMYKCNTAISTPEAFDSNKWDETNCGEQFKQINSNLSEYVKGTTAVETGTLPTVPNTGINTKLFDWPTGFSYNNCFVTTAFAEDSGTYYPLNFGSSAANDDSYYYFQADGFYMHMSRYNTLAQKPYSVTLMRLY